MKTAKDWNYRSVMGELKPVGSRRDEGRFILFRVVERSQRLILFYTFRSLGVPLKSEAEVVQRYPEDSLTIRAVKPELDV